MRLKEDPEVWNTVESGIVKKVRMVMNVLRIELVREIGNAKTYKIIYEENESIEVTNVGHTFNYDGDALNFPELVLDFAERWILSNL